MAAQPLSGERARVLPSIAALYYRVELEDSENTRGDGNRTAPEDGQECSDAPPYDRPRKQLDIGQAAKTGRTIVFAQAKVVLLEPAPASKINDACAH
jgi:hypothetical protein